LIAFVFASHAKSGAYSMPAGGGDAARKGRGKGKLSTRSEADSQKSVEEAENSEASKEELARKSEELKRRLAASSLVAKKDAVGAAKETEPARVSVSPSPDAVGSPPGDFKTSGAPDSATQVPPVRPPPPGTVPSAASAEKPADIASTGRPGRFAGVEAQAGSAAGATKPVAGDSPQANTPITSSGNEQQQQSALTEGVNTEKSADASTPRPAAKKRPNLNQGLKATIGRALGAPTGRGSTTSTPATTASASASVGAAPASSPPPVKQAIERSALPPRKKPRLELGETGLWEAEFTRLSKSLNEFIVQQSLPKRTGAITPYSAEKVRELREYLDGLVIVVI